MSNRQFEAFLTEAETHFFEHRLTCGGNLTIKRAVAKAVKHSAIALETWGMTDEQQEFMTHMVHILQTIMKSGMSECHDRELCHHSIMSMYHVLINLFCQHRICISYVPHVVTSCKLYLLSSSMSEW